MTLNFKNEGDTILLIGDQKNDIASSEYLHKLKAVEYSPAPDFNLDHEFKIQSFVASIIKDKLIQSAHDISEGGLAITLLESGFTNNLGFTVAANEPARKDAFWFGEAQSRVVVSVAKDKLATILTKAKTDGVTITELGTVTAGDIQVNGNSWGNISSWKINMILPSKIIKLDAAISNHCSYRCRRFYWFMHHSIA